ncbi:hypothetical protein [Parasphingorhabdus sp.]|uniref:hypothetical protein n=1 Tax=Parasphingorhabdus sp. TaxID=2709688 RepID=UPI0032EF7585
MFAKRGFHPDDIWISRNAEDYCVQIVFNELDQHTARIVFESIRAKAPAAKSGKPKAKAKKKD